MGLALSEGPAAWGDVNGDGWPDLWCSGVVWLNRDGKDFTRVAAPGAGVLADLNNDGLADLVSFAPVGIFRTVKVAEGSFRFDPVPLPELPATASRGASVADFNGDGFVDIYIAGFEDWEKQITYPSFLLLNERGERFTLAMTSGERRARGVTACDFDEDGDTDVYVSNYRLQPNVLWMNDGHGVMTDEGGKRNALATSPGFDGGHSIGAAFGDFDGDGHFDLFAGNFAHVDNRGDQPKSRFLRNTGSAQGWVFEDLHECGVWYQESYASPGAGDYDNDGRLDLLFTTVYADASFGKKNHAVLYRNETEVAGAGGVGKPWVFADRTAGSGLENLQPTYQAAWADVDGDGNLDVVTAGKLFMNRRPKAADGSGRWVEVRLIGDGVHVNRGAVGAQARLRLADGRVLSRQVEAGTGEGNSNSPILHFGVGDAKGPCTIEVRWPGVGKDLIQNVENVGVGQQITVTMRPSP